MDFEGRRLWWGSASHFFFALVGQAAVSAVPWQPVRRAIPRLDVLAGISRQTGSSSAAAATHELQGLVSGYHAFGKILRSPSSPTRSYR
jgi:hypothetical protein